MNAPALGVPCGQALGNETLILPLIQQGVFRVDEDGSIWRLADRSRSKKLKPLAVPRRVDALRPDGYRHFEVRLNGRRLHISAHRLVWTAINGPIPDGFEINHRDGNRSNNNPSNLEPLTPKENSVHSYRALGKQSQKGERNGRAKLTIERVSEIRRLSAEGMTQHALGARFGVTPRAIRYALSGVTWRDSEAAS